MNRKIIILTAAVIAAGLAVCSCSSDSGSGKSSAKETVSQLSMDDIKGINGGAEPEIQYYYGTETISTLQGKYSDTKVKDKDDALYVIKELSGLLNIKDPDTELRFSTHNPGAKSSAYVFDQFYKELPTSGRISVIVDNEGNTFALSNSYISGLDMDTEPSLSAEAAAEKAKNKAKGELKGEPELMVYSDVENGAKLAWHVSFRSSSYPNEVWVDAMSGGILSEDGPIDD